MQEMSCLHSQVLAFEACVASLGLLAAKAYRERPRGWVRSDLVVTGPSPLAGTGLFASRPIASGTVLGAYPGRPRSWEDMKKKYEAAPASKQYVFTTGDIDGWRTTMV